MKIYNTLDVYKRQRYLFMGRVLTEETKQKRLEVFYQKAIKKAEAEIGNKYQMLTIIGVDYERTRD